MQDIYSYTVAGFRFCIEGSMPSMPNLAPFLSEEGEELFHLELVSSMVPIPSTPVFKTDDGPGFPEISIDALKDGGYRFRMRPLPGKPLAAELRTNGDFTHGSLLFVGEDHSFALNNALMLLFAFASARNGVLEMHSSVVISGGKGYLFLGKSGTGKSTHSSLWLKHIPGTELLNDDNPILRLMPDGSARVYGSPWSGKTPCYRSGCPHPTGTLQQNRASSRHPGLCLADGIGLQFPSVQGTGRRLAPDTGRPGVRPPLLCIGLPAGPGRRRTLLQNRPWINVPSPMRCCWKKPQP